MLKAMRPKEILFWSVTIVALTLMALQVSNVPLNNTELDESVITASDKSDLAQEIIDNHLCPCGCGRFLPGSRNQPACFGCSVGKAEVSRILESLAEGRTPDEIRKELNESVLIDVFSDYTDKQLPEIWERVKRVASEQNQHRVVLRALGLTTEARMPIKLVECARAQGMFDEFLSVLIEHPGPWDEHTLLELGIELGMNEDTLSNCLNQTDVSAQIAKDREHAKMLKVDSIPVVSINRKTVLPTEENLRRALRRVIIEESI